MSRDDHEMGNGSFALYFSLWNDSVCEATVSFAELCDNIWKCLTFLFI